MNHRAASLYMHAPFCIRRCRYSDFCSQPLDDELAPAVMAAEVRQLRRRGPKALASPVETIFIGGGTPTALAPALLQSLLGAAGTFAAAETEWTVEANPATLDDATLALLGEAGVNRLSIGVQSFDDAELAMLGRLHDRAEARGSLPRARRAGFENISLDLIYGLPGQSLPDWRASLSEAIDLGPEHLSCYCLSLPAETPLAQDVARGVLPAPDETVQRLCYEEAIERLTAAGYEHYEISNFARPGRRCRHNLVYWDNQPYLGVGPSAVSYLDGVRARTVTDLAEYVRAVEAGADAVAESERLEGRAVASETMMLNLRMIRGLDRARFARRFGFDPADEAAGAVAHLADLGLLEVSEDRLRLAPAGLFVADAVIAALMDAVNP